MGSIASGGSGGVGGSSLSLPAGTGVLKVHGDGSLDVSPVTADEVLAAFAVSLSGGYAVDVGTVLTTPPLVAGYSATPTSVILGAAVLAGGATTNTAGTTSPNETSTPSSFNAPGIYTFPAPGASVSLAISAHTATSPTKSASTAWTASNKLFLGTGAPGMGSVDTSGVSTGRTDAQVAAFILSLASSQLASSRAGSFSVLGLAGQKIYEAFPSRFGVPTSYVAGGFTGTYFVLVATVPVTRSGYTETFYLLEKTQFTNATFAWSQT